jgi:hypothetical protein
MDFDSNHDPDSTGHVNALIFRQIFAMFTNLQHLNFGSSLLLHQRLSFYVSPPTVASSTLLELHVYLEHFTDYLYLLDGPFNQLHTLHVNISHIIPSRLIINHKVNYFD